MKAHLLVFFTTLTLINYFPCQNTGSSFDQESLTDLSSQYLPLQNEARMNVDLSPLMWNETLALTAQDFANSLAANDVFAHPVFSGTGENIWSGPTGSLSIAEIIQVWISEKQFYKDDVFPNISTTGDWKNAANYSQIIWTSTTNVGCGFATSIGGDYYVCRYFPKGNILSVKQPRLPRNFDLGNQERESLGPVYRLFPNPLLKWSDSLSISAQDYADYLAQNNIFEHSQNPKIGENLWSGPVGVYSFNQMVQVWLNEKKFFVNNAFPNVSLTGDPNKVANYTRIIWLDASWVGCGLANNSVTDYLVCHFDPPGNVVGIIPLVAAPLNGIRESYPIPILAVPVNPTGNNVTDSLDAQNQMRVIRNKFYSNLSWDNSLADSAQDFANYLASNDIFEHSGNFNIGENIWSGPTGVFTIYQIIQVWLNEYSNRKLGASFYPFVSWTGKWADVANYSQITERIVTKVGCGLASSKVKDYYVCHYDIPWRRGAQCKFKEIDLKFDSLNHHNQIRQLNNLNNLTWDEELASSAQDFANYLAEKNIFEHSGNLTVGENLWSSDLITFSICQAVYGWLEGIVVDGSFHTDNANYSQLTWAGMNKLGCGIATSILNNYYVCHYDSPWNRSAQYRFREWDVSYETRLLNSWTDRIFYNPLQNRLPNTGSAAQFTENSFLVQSAQSQAEYLATNSIIFEHTKNTSVGETLWVGPTRTLSLTQMIQIWLDEKRLFVNNAFPNVSITGDWNDVSNYTQIMWTDTRFYGCGFANSATNDYLVCHYYPRGNIEGIRPLSTPLASINYSDAVGALNSARKEYFVDLLIWDDSLASSSLSFAQYLADNRIFEHSSNQEGGENIWRGPAGFLSVAEIVVDWINEKKFYQNGIFPNVSTAGDWRQVGNYTQIIWSDTRKVGCGIARVFPYDYFVCHFAPAGNIIGQNPIDGANTPFQRRQDDRNEEM